MNKAEFVESVAGKTELSRRDAERAFPGAEPDLQTREVRDLPGAGETPPSSRPGGRWS